MKILITGAEGFIGSHLTGINKGHSVKCLTLYNSFNNWGWLDTLSIETKKKIEVIQRCERQRINNKSYEKS